MSFTALLVAPVGGAAILGPPVHLTGPNLHFKRLTTLADHSDVQAAYRTTVGEDGPPHNYTEEVLCQ